MYLHVLIATENIEKTKSYLQQKKQIAPALGFEATPCRRLFFKANSEIDKANVKEHSSFQLVKKIYDGLACSQWVRF